MMLQTSKERDDIISNLMVGSAVEVMLRTGGHWYKGTVLATFSAETNVFYGDGPMAILATDDDLFGWSVDPEDEEYTLNDGELYIRNHFTPKYRYFYYLVSSETTCIKVVSIPTPTMIIGYKVVNDEA